MVNTIKDKFREFQFAWYSAKLILRFELQMDPKIESVPSWVLLEMRSVDTHCYDIVCAKLNSKELHGFNELQKLIKAELDKRKKELLNDY